MSAQQLFIFIAIFTLSLLSLTTGALAYVASSTNYRIERHDINVGGRLSSSTSYIEEDTVGGIGSGYSSSTNFLLHAGYRQQASTTLSISSPSDVELLPALDGAVGGTANGSADWAVTTNNAAGYSLTLSASTDPALVSGTNTFANYTLPAAPPEFTWSVASSASEFGFTPEGTDIASRYKDDGTACNAGALDTSLSCWDPIQTTNTTIASRTTTALSGATTTANLRAEIGTTRNQPAGTYQATLTATALAL